VSVEEFADGATSGPLVAVELGGMASAAALERAVQRAGDQDGPLVGIGGGTPAARALAPYLDVTLARIAERPESVACEDPDEALDALASAARRNPQAALVLAGVLRAGAALPVRAALDLESFAYSTLLGGTEFAAWLADRGPRPLPPDVPDPVTVDRTGGLLRITLNRPERRNAYGRAVRDALVEALTIAELDPTVEEVVLTGAGPVFSAGGDLAEFGTTPDLTTAHFVRTRGGAGLPLHRLRDRVTARVHGFCVGAGIELPALEDWNGNTPQPDFNVLEGVADFTDRQRGAYLASRFNLSDELKVIIGANITHARSGGSNYGTSRARSETVTTPYVGAVYDISDTLSAYASYTEIFTPQSEVAANFKTLDPITGKNIEGGLKAEWLDARLLGTLSVFRSEQSNLANRLGMIGSVTVFEGTDVASQGFELELSGQITERLQIAGGYTQLMLEDDDGNDTRLYTPRRIVRLTAAYRVPGIDALKLGANLGWRSQTGSLGAALPVKVRQPAYALLNLMARYDINDNLYASLNVNNVTDKRYLTSLYWADQGYYGAPRNASVSLTWKY